MGKVHCGTGKLQAPAGDSIARFFPNLVPKSTAQAGPQAPAGSPAQPPPLPAPAPVTNGRPETGLSPHAPSAGSLPLPGPSSNGSRTTGSASEREDNQGTPQDTAPGSLLAMHRNQTPLRTPRLAPDPKVVRPSDLFSLPQLPTSRSSARGDGEVCTQSFVSWLHACSIAAYIMIQPTRVPALSKRLPFGRYQLCSVSSEVPLPFLVTVPLRGLPSCVFL